MANEPWFYAPRHGWSTTHVSLPPDESHHARRVLRLAPNDVIIVTDGNGAVARCVFERVDGEDVTARVLEQDRRVRPRPLIALYQGRPKGHKADDVIERVAELGVAEAWIFESERSVARWDGGKLERLAERWRAIARATSKQSRNPFCLEVGGGLSWDDLVSSVEREPFTIVLWEDAVVPLRAALTPRPERVALVVGPEGGLSRMEAESLAGAGASLASLGSLVLRTENAAVVAASAVAFHYGLIG